MAFPVVRVCVTVVGLVQSSFLCAPVSSYCCNLCVCHYMWSEFYCAQCLGHLDQFVECFSVFFCIFSVFLPWNRLPKFFCVSRSLFSILLSPYVVAKLACVGLFIHGFSSFSVCLLRVLHSTTGRRTCFRSFNVGSSIF